MEKHCDTCAYLYQAKDRETVLPIRKLRQRCGNLAHNLSEYPSRDVEYRAILCISTVALEQINKYLSAKRKDEYQGEDNTITYTVRFPDGKEMDVKCCGCRDEASWTEAVLFDERGCQIACSDVEETFDGPWELEADGVLYITKIVVDQIEYSCLN